MNKSLLTALLALSLVGNAHGQAGPLGDITVSGAFDYESQYVFRGKKLTQGAFQPSVNLAKPVLDGSLNVGIWTSQPIGNNTAGATQTNEIDIGATWQHKIPGVGDDVTGQVGVLMYWYPDASGAGAVTRTYELNLGVIYDSSHVLPYDIHPTLMYYHDLVLDSNTFTAAVHYDFDLSDSTGVKGLSLTPTATLGWTGIHRVFGDSVTPPAGNWSNSYTYWQLDLELDYKLNTSTQLFLGTHYAGNNDGNQSGVAPVPGGSPQFPGTANSLWFGLGVRFNY